MYTEVNNLACPCIIMGITHCLEWVQGESYFRSLQKVFVKYSVYAITSVRHELNCDVTRIEPKENLWQWIKIQNYYKL
jgi:hypothetical protein